MNNALWSPRGARAGERTRAAGGTGFSYVLTNLLPTLILFCNNVPHISTFLNTFCCGQFWHSDTLFPGYFLPTFGVFGYLNMEILNAVLRIRDIFLYGSGSAPLTNGSGSGSWYFRLFLIFFAYCFLKLHLHQDKKS
jgi:hypothetical protein